MKFLNLDLDFFQMDVVHNCNDYGERLDSFCTKPWKEEDLISYLEGNLGLSKDKKIKGRIVEHHHEIFYFWRELILNGELTVPFDVIHVDAHSDLGLGDASWHYIMTEYLHKNINDRIYPENLEYSHRMYRFDYGNYLTFAVACNWVNSIHFIPHTSWENDLPITIFKNYDEKTNTIQLKKFNKNETLYFNQIRKYKPISYEREVPFTINENLEIGEKDKIDYIGLSISPGYTVKESDTLINTIKEYMEIV